MIENLKVKLIDIYYKTSLTDGAYFYGEASLQFLKLFLTIRICVSTWCFLCLFQKGRSD